jgi:hypothetical protein
MRRLLTLVGVVTVLVLAHPASVCAQAGCGLTPLKPLLPLGCKDLLPRCQCVSTDTGTTCRWVWDCVPSES